MCVTSVERVVLITPQLLLSLMHRCILGSLYIWTLFVSPALFAPYGTPAYYSLLCPLAPSSHVSQHSSETNSLRSCENECNSILKILFSSRNWSWWIDFAIHFEQHCIRNRKFKQFHISLAACEVFLLFFLLIASCDTFAVLVRDQSYVCVCHYAFREEKGATFTLWSSLGLGAKFVAISSDKFGFFFPLSVVCSFVRLYFCHYCPHFGRFHFRVSSVFHSDTFCCPLWMK